MKKLFIMVVCLLATFGCFAQSSTGQKMLDSKNVQGNTQNNKYAVVTNDFLSNWFVSAGGGTALYFGDRSSEMKFTDRLFGTFNLSVGKWFTPGIGVRLNGQMLFVKTSCTSGVHGNGWYDQSTGLYKQKFDAFNAGGDLMFNVSNLIFGYNSKRLYNLVPYAGVGIIFTRDKPRDNEMSLSVGLLNTFRLCSNIDLNFDVRGIMFGDGLNGNILGGKNDGMLSMSLGLTYKFGSKGHIAWDHYRPVASNLRYTEAQMDEIRGKINALQGENAQLAERVNHQPKGVDTVFVGEKNSQIPPVLVLYRVGQATLTQDMRVNIGFFVQQFKSLKTKPHFVVTGYTDKSGSFAINEKLAKMRAFAVFNCLTREFGLDASFFKMDYKVGASNLFYDNPALNRAAIISVEK